MDQNRKQKQYSGWNSEAEAASLDKWTKAGHLDDTIRRIRDKEMGHTEKLMYFKQELSKLKCFSFSETKRIPSVWDAVNISKGEIKTYLDKVESLADERRAVEAAEDARPPVVIDILDNYNKGLGLIWQHWQENGLGDAWKALDAAFDALECIQNALEEWGSLKLTMTREELENKLGITWGPQAGGTQTRKRKGKESNLDDTMNSCLTQKRKRKRKQMQYSGWSSEAEAASSHEWIDGMKLVDTIRRIGERDFSVAEELAYTKKALRGLKRYSFSQTKRFPIFIAVNVSEGVVKTNIDKLESLADEMNADKSRDTMIGNNGNVLDFWPRDWGKRTSDAHSAMHDAYYEITEDVLEHRSSITYRDEMEEKLGITWKATRVD